MRGKMLLEYYDDLKGEAFCEICLFAFLLGVVTSSSLPIIIKLPSNHKKNREVNEIS